MINDLVAIVIPRPPNGLFFDLNVIPLVPFHINFQLLEMIREI
jgi:hypothetical protein